MKILLTTISTVRVTTINMNLTTSDMMTADSIEIFENAHVYNSPTGLMR